jgi:hypothetical protein
VRKEIRELFIDPPLAIARLGGSSVPQDAYVWIAAPQPRIEESTAIAPTWSLAVQQDGTVEPFMPTELVFRDSGLIRPVCPFFEIWCRVGVPGSRDSEVLPLRPALLAQCGASVRDLSLLVDAKNFKAARRTGNPNLRYGTFPSLIVRGDVNVPVPLLATSPNGIKQPMIPPDNPIPMGYVQMLASRPALPAHDPRAIIDVERLRLRFTPARGLMYGGKSAAQPHATPNGGRATPVPKERAFLNPEAGWLGAPDNGMVEPSDTYDGADIHQDLSLGVVDDTCEARLEVRLALPGRLLSANAHVFVGPPDFAPDRRPFLSLADELNDRGAAPEARSRGMSDGARDEWIQDLFERVFETTTLFNVDFYRLRNAARLTGRQLADKSIPNDHLPRRQYAMGGRDRLRKAKKDEQPLPAANRDVPLPLSQRAVSRHRELSDLSGLREFIEAHPGRIKQLVRAPFDMQPGEDADRTTMQMPPFMRNSNAEPLSLATWQYDLLLAWVKEQERQKKKPQPQSLLKRAAKSRRTEVLARVARARRPPA